MQTLVSRGACFLFIVLVVLPGLPASEFKQALGVSFKIVTSRHLDTDESESLSPPDVIGWEKAVRLRLCSSDTAVLILTPADPVVFAPVGYAVLTPERDPKWRTFYGKGGLSHESPGVQALQQEQPTEWVVLPPNTCIEWEKVTDQNAEPDGTGYTVFVKGTDSGSAVFEVVSEVN